VLISGEIVEVLIEKESKIQIQWSGKPENMVTIPKRKL
jgi:hypothetical protein